MLSTREQIENVLGQLNAELEGDGDLDERQRIRISVLRDEHTRLGALLLAETYRGDSNCPHKMLY